MGRKREYVVIEPMRAANIFTVQATSRAEALAKVRNWDHAEDPDIYCDRPAPEPVGAFKVMLGATYDRMLRRE